MSFDGSGNYLVPAGTAAISGAVINASNYNALLTDLQTALTKCVTRDGQSPPTANLPMASRKLTGLSAGSVAGDSVRFEQIALAALGAAALGANTDITSLNAPALGAATATTQAGSDNSTKVATTAMVQSASNGIASGTQTWQNVAASRALSTSYTNSTGRAILAVVNAFSLGAGAYISTFVNGQAYGLDTAGSGAGGYVTTYMTVLNGQTYQVSHVNMQLNTWWELR